MTTRRDDPLAVLEHASWLESLARGLVADPGLAEDLAQETRILAWSHRPDSDRPLRGWLATVMRNLLRQHRRAEARRDSRDRLVVDAAEVDPISLATRLEAHRAVIDAVADLHEPYRSTILLRYFEGKSPKEIAVQSNVPLATVKTRLQRAIASLRERLDRDHARDGRSWKLALAPLLRAPDLPLAALLGVLIVNVKILSIVGVVLLGTGALFWTRSDAPSTESISRASAPIESERVVFPPVLEGGDSFRDEARAEKTEAEVAAPTSSLPSVASPVAAPKRIRGEVLDADARPVPGIELVVARDSGGEPSSASENVQVTTDAGGRFEVEAPEDWTRIIATEPGWTTIFPGARTLGDAAVVIVVSRAIACSGVVVDERSVPQAAATVEYVLPVGFRARFERVLDTAGEFLRVETTKEDGTFDFGAAPRIEGATIRAERSGFEAASITAPDRDSRELRLVLTIPAVATHRIEGVVLDPFGAPVEDAHVSLRGETTLTDAAGRFAIALDDGDWIDRIAAEMRAPKDRVAERLAVMGFGASSPLGSKLIAVKEGYLAAIHAADPEGTGPKFPAHVVLQLGAEPLTIGGRVLAADGTPARGARVWVADPESFGLVSGQTPATLENLIAGAAPDEWRFASTDERGEFELDGLTPRPYRLVAMDRNLVRVSLSGVPAGSKGVEIRFPADAVHAHILGRVVTIGGAPVGSARVVLRNDAFSLAGRTHHGSGAAVITGPDGRFEFTDVPREGVFLRVDGEGILPREFGRDLARIDELVDEAGRSAGVLELELRVSARCHLQVQLVGANEADQFGVVDAAGEAVPIELFSGSRRTTRPRFELVEGKSPVVAVREDASAVVLYRGDQEVRRIPIALEVGKVNEVGP